MLYPTNMCGISGFIDLKGNIAKEQLEKIIISMNDKVVHRGPDSSGTWVDTDNSLALGHRRLSIIDLSDTGHQPMVSPSGRYIITYNGEIYNFQIIKTQLLSKKYKFKGTSDTEVLLGAIDCWGLKKALGKIDGMFAFALWDKKEKTLFLARDRIGKKPLYYGIYDNIFFFSSELKSIRAHPQFTPTIDREAVSAYLRHNYIPSPFSIYKGIKKLEQASYLSFSPANNGNIKIENYWDIKKIAEEGCANPFTLDHRQILEGLDKKINKSVSERMMSDVPIGSFLSGGIDSSLVTAVMQKNSNKPIKTFCVGFGEGEFNEAKSAKAIAKYLGTDHTELYLSPQEALNVIPEMAHIYDEPFADPSQIPTLLISRLAKKHVTVALSGDGGDELFAGYSRYNLANNIAKICLALPLSLRKAVIKVSHSLPVHGRFYKLLELFDAKDQDDLYFKLMSFWKEPSNVVINGYESESVFNKMSGKVDLSNFYNKMMYIDMVSYLPDDILTKVDRASMANSLECRCPLLDYQLIEYAWRIPLSLKMDGGKGKYILRSLLEEYIPKELFDRPKQGFGIPHHQWLRNELKEWAGDLLNENRLKQDGIFRADLVQKRWEEHLSGKFDWGYHIWSILMFQSWYDAQRL